MHASRQRREIAKCAPGKLSRIRSGEPPRTVEMFAGCGGLTLGFVIVGCRSLLGVEPDAAAAASHAANFSLGHEAHRHDPRAR